MSRIDPLTRLAVWPFRAGGLGCSAFTATVSQLIELRSRETSSSLWTRHGRPASAWHGAMPQPPKTNMRGRPSEVLHPTLSEHSVAVCPERGSTGPPLTATCCHTLRVVENSYVELCMSCRARGAETHARQGEWRISAAEDGESGSRNGTGHGLRMWGEELGVRPLACQTEETPPKRMRVLDHATNVQYERGVGVSPEVERESFCHARSRAVSDG